MMVEVNKATAMFRTESPQYIKSPIAESLQPTTVAGSNL